MKSDRLRFYIRAAGAGALLILVESLVVALLLVSARTWYFWDSSHDDDIGFTIAWLGLGLIGTSIRLVAELWATVFILRLRIPKRSTPGDFALSRILPGTIFGFFFLFDGLPYKGHLNIELLLGLTIVLVSLVLPFLVAKRFPQLVHWIRDAMTEEL
jgi:hypothetical protein